MSPWKKLARRADRLPIVPIVATMLGLALAFFCFAMPIAQVERIVMASGLPSLLAAAHPPLGTKAQALFSLGSGVAAAIAVVLGFAALGGSRPLPDRPIADPAIPDDMIPRQRAADAHPDAPARRPIFAGKDFGDPLDLDQSLIVREEDLEAIDGWQAPAASTEIVEASWTPVEQIEVEPIVEDVQAAPLPAWREDVRAAEIDEDKELTVDDLVARLEAGLARRRANVNVTPLRAAPGASEDGERLRAAIDELQRMAGRAN